MNTRRVGHAGTLDPAATGVLAVFVGKATRLIQYFGGLKVYESVFRFGTGTTTDDAEGEIIHSAPVPELTIQDWRSHVTSFTGVISQVPPAVSAVHCDGQRAYKIVRNGEIPDLKPREVFVESIDLLKWSPPDLEVRVTCGSGTYIRSLARDLGEKLGTAGHVATLRRTQSGIFDIAGSLPLDQIAESVSASGPDAVLQPPGDLLLRTMGQTLTLTAEDSLRFRYGNRVTPSDTEPMEGPIAVSDTNNEFVGIGRWSDGELKPVLVWASASI